MSDKRVVFERDGVRVYGDGTCESRWGPGEWRPYNDNIPAVVTLARALAESEAKVARMTAALTEVSHCNAVFAPCRDCTDAAKKALGTHG